MRTDRLNYEAVGAAISFRAYVIGQHVLVRATVAALQAHSLIVRIPCAKTGSDLPVDVPACEVFLPESTDAAYQAAQLLLRRLDDLHDAGLRTIAEVYELGGHALMPAVNTALKAGA